MNMVNFVSRFQKILANKYASNLERHDSIEGTLAIDSNKC